MVTGEALGDFRTGALEAGIALTLGPFEKHIFALESI